MLASVSGSITSFVGDHGVYAVFLLMAIDAVFPAASELVMVYAGALASGAFASQHVVLFGHQIEPGGWAFLTMALAGTLGYIVGAIGGWAIGRYGGRPFVERHGRFQNGRLVYRGTYLFKVFAQNSFGPVDLSQAFVIRR